MKKIGILLATVALAAIAASSVQAGNTQPPVVTPPANSYCLNGQDVALPAPISFGNVIRMLTQNTAEAVLADPGFTNGNFWFGYLDGTYQTVLAYPSERDLLADYPAPSFNQIYRGKCVGKYVATDREFWLCYSSGYPWVGSRADAMKLYDDGKGWKVPVAVLNDSTVVGPNIGNGIRLSCDFSKYSRQVPNVAVSTGGGERYFPPWDLTYMLNKMPLDYTIQATTA